jgi:hypothetical protein
MSRHSNTWAAEEFEETVLEIAKSFILRLNINQPLS